MCQSQQFLVVKILTSTDKMFLICNDLKPESIKSYT